MSLGMVKGFAALAAFAAALSAQAGSCAVRSGDHTTALVELYTSEGCDSCPPADHWLSSLGARGRSPSSLVPIALHVDYWDYIGWKDPYAKREFSIRQRKLAQLKRAKIVYTPQVLLQGEDFRRWGTPAFDAAVARINAQPAKARIALRLAGAAAGSFEVEADAELLDASQQGAAALYLAAYENKLTSAVHAGENRGKTLAHDFVVLEWLGPYAFSPGLRLSQRHTVPLLPGAVAKNSGIAAFVQNRSTAEVLQAIMLPACGV